mmetsp:Transcript_20083/g.55861  ORF Transcript_20083/g.55861 Transcript_20083/m.55861 type:complete len:212 (+) Transcript_20083:881-1516(+)
MAYHRAGTGAWNRCRFRPSVELVDESLLQRTTEPRTVEFLPSCLFLSNRGSESWLARLLEGLITLTVLFIRFRVSSGIVQHKRCAVFKTNPHPSCLLVQGRRSSFYSTAHLSCSIHSFHCINRTDDSFFCFGGTVDGLDWSHVSCACHWVLEILRCFWFPFVLFSFWRISLARTASERIRVMMAHQHHQHHHQQQQHPPRKQPCGPLLFLP